MATLAPYFAIGTTTGSKESIWVKILGYQNVGSGSFEAFSDFAADFKGRISTIFYKGDLDLQMELTDHDPAATSGPATVTINGVTDAGAKYSTASGTLTVKATFDGEAQDMMIRRISGGGETEINLKGAQNRSIHLQPAMNLALLRQMLAEIDAGSR